MRKLTAALCLISLLLLAGCQASSLPDPLTVVVLADTTASARSAKTRMAADFDTVLEGISANTHVALVSIEANSLVSPIQMAVEPALASSKSLFGQYNQYSVRRALKEAKEQARADFLKLLDRSEGGRPGSALIEAVARSQKLLEDAKGQRALVILSDGYEQGARVDFTQLTAEAVGPLIESLRQAGQVPDLKGTCVYFAGITEGSPPLPDETVRTVGRFWEAYFQAANAELVWYDASLLHFAPAECGVGAPS